ncbi:MAG: diguanylate cyclase, partial [Spirochaetaceae bacterium]|nr:diguanylate cyclase [Spirochaetaceae bacterium]
DSSGEGPARGRMVFGRFYGEKDAERLSALLRVELDFQAAEGAVPTGVKGLEPILADQGADFRVIAPIPGIAGGFAGAIVLRHEKRVIAEGAGIIRAVLAVTTTVGLVLLAALFLVMQRGAALPVIRLSARARELAGRKDFSERLPAGRDDEIGELAESFNNLLDRLAAANHGLEERVAERTEELLRANDELRLMGEIFSHAREGILVTNADARILAVNPAFERITGIAPELAVGRNPRIMRGGRQGPEFYRTLWERLTRDGAWSGELWNKRPSGEEYPIWISISALKGPGGETTRYVGVLHDISESKRQEEIIRYQAFHDELTGLPNRHLLSDRVTSAIERAKRRGLAAAIVFLDLDRFKVVNDCLGHAAGDELLKETARRLSRVARGEDTIARLGGDEFVILLEEVADGRIPADVALRVIKSLGRPVEIDGKSVRVGASVGIAIFPEDGADAETLLRNADAAMYRAKEEGRNTYRLFTAELNEKVARRLSVESELRRDVESRSLLVRYQPQVRLATGKTAGLEALVR